uniref:GDNF/GAS1 domain-containing protein n=1 Tax=Seriola dumerili TaxID=41447 RepID=A0A3B4VP99_SERDU
MENPVFLLPSCVCVIQDEGCQIKGSEVCNMTIQTILDRFPSLRGCVCAWEGELCDSIQALATQCHKKPGAVFSVLSAISIYIYDAAASCFDRMRVCVSDAVCNRYLAPVLQACTADPCHPERCQQVTQHFYGGMPQNVAEMLVMCECEASDQSCLHMRTALHSGTCEDETRICQDTVIQCVDDSNCRYVAVLWKSYCEQRNYLSRILGADFECKTAFLATLGTALHHPCSCRGMHNDELKTCKMIHDVLHNRSYFSEYGFTGELKNQSTLSVFNLFICLTLTCAINHSNTSSMSEIASCHQLSFCDDLSVLLASTVPANKHHSKHSLFDENSV